MSEHWSVETTPIDDGTQDLRCVAFDTDNGQLATAEARNAEHIWAFGQESWDELASFSISDRIQDVAYSPDSSICAFAGSERWDQLQLYDPSDWSAAPDTFEPSGGRGRALAWAPDGEFLAIAIHDPHELFVYETDTWTVDESDSSLPDEPRTADVSPDGEYLVVGTNTTAALVYETDTWTVEETISLPDSTETARFSPGGDWLAVGVDDSSVGCQIYSTADWTVAETLDDSGTYVRGLEWSPDGELLATGTVNGDLYVHDTADWSVDFTEAVAGDNIRAVDFSANGAWLALASDDGSLTVYNTPIDAGTYADVSGTVEVDGETVEGAKVTGLITSEDPAEVQGTDLSDGSGEWAIEYEVDTEAMLLCEYDDGEEQYQFEAKPGVGVEDLENQSLTLELTDE